MKIQNDLLYKSFEDFPQNTHIHGSTRKSDKSISKVSESPKKILSGLR